jgi:hypothetical protein
MLSEQGGIGAAGRFQGVEVQAINNKDFDFPLNYL